MSNNTGSTILALLTGAAIGAGFGLLYAPESGKDTRKKLKKEANKAKDKLGKEYEDLSGQVTEFANTAKSNFEKKVDKLFKSASNEADNIITDMESELETLRKKNNDLNREVDNLKA